MSIKVGSGYVNSLQKLNFSANPEKAEEKVEIPTTAPDSLIIKKAVEPPKIGNTRLIFSRLTSKQIEQVNESGKLPANAKFVKTEQGGYVIRPNWFNVITGTRTIPAGFEIKKNLLGFSKVLPKDSAGLFIRN